MQQAKTLFEENSLAGLPLRNRLVRSATLEGLADAQGQVTPRLVEIYQQLAAGGCGLIISGFTYVDEPGKPYPGAMGMVHDEQIAGVAELAAAVHAAGAKFCLQLAHAGGQTRQKICGVRPVAPSAVEVAQFAEVPAEMTVEQISAAVDAFARAAARAKQAGCDAVQLHCAHGYLINQFLSPLTNRRSDRYGGDFEGRSRFLREVVVAVRQAVGEGFPVLVKLNGSDNLEGGLEIDEAIEAAQLLDGLGFAAIEVSAGTPGSGARMPIRLPHESGEELAYNVVLARTIRQQVNCPVVVVGGIRSRHVMDGLLRTGQADYISLCRPLIREPDLPNKLRRGESEKATCISCNGCLKTMLKGTFSCVIP